MGVAGIGLRDEVRVGLIDSRLRLGSCDKQLGVQERLMHRRGHSLLFLPHWRRRVAQRIWFSPSTPIVVNWAKWRGGAPNSDRKQGSSAGWGNRSQTIKAAHLFFAHLRVLSLKSCLVRPPPSLFLSLSLSLSLSLFLSLSLSSSFSFSLSLSLSFSLSPSLPLSFSLLPPSLSLFLSFCPKFSLFLSLFLSPSLLAPFSIPLSLSLFLSFSLSLSFFLFLFFFLSLKPNSYCTEFFFAYLLFSAFRMVLHYRERNGKS